LHISYFFHISQGSVATQLRCGGMFSNHFITNFPQSAPVKKFWESVDIWQRYGQNFVAYFFGATLYIFIRHYGSKTDTSIHFIFHYHNV